jgi:hypothetical protein
VNPFANSKINCQFLRIGPVNIALPSQFQTIAPLSMSSTIPIHNHTSTISPEPTSISYDLILSEQLTHTKFDGVSPLQSPPYRAMAACGDRKATLMEDGEMCRDSIQNPRGNDDHSS